MTADKVDPLPSPASDRAITDRQLVEAGALDAVVIPLRPDVANLDVIKRDAGDGIRQVATIVEVQAVGSLAAEAQVSQRELFAAGEVPRIAAAFEMRRIFWIESLDGEPFDAAEVMTARIVTGSDFQRGAGLEITQSGAQRIDITHDDFITGSQTAEDQKQGSFHGVARPSGNWARRSSSVTSW
jgi:hypothetical protein